MEMTFEKHCTDDSLELYALGRLEGQGMEELEEHLLLCGSCRYRLDEADAYVRAMRSAAARLRHESRDASRHVSRGQSGRVQRSESFVEQVNRAFRLSAFHIWAMSAACVGVLAISVIWVRQPGPAGPPILVSLRAERGASQTVAAHHPLTLSLDTRGLNLGDSPRVVLVNADGASLEQGVLQTGRSAAVNDQLRARFSKPLAKGDYFVRIYLPGVNDPVREYALQAQ